MAPIFDSGKLVANRYQIVEQLFHYKELFKCIDQTTGDNLILKVEIIDGMATNRLLTEWRLYERLSPNKCFDFVINYLSDKQFRYLVMRPLGDNLYEFWKQKLRQNQWNLETVVKFADEMISRVATCHIRGVIHRDIKPENFVVDKNNNNYLYLIDFNLAKQFSSATVPHIPYQIRSPKYSIGNIQFLSVNAHKGEEQSRRDDLISICYSLVYLAKGSLPWSGLRSRQYASRMEYMAAVGQKKLNCPIDELCDGLPVQFKQFMNYCLELEFEQNPDYFQIRKIFSHLLMQMRASNVTSVQYHPNHDSGSTSQSVPNKSGQKFSERFKKCLKCSPPSMGP